MTDTTTYTVAEALSHGPLARFGRDLNRFLGAGDRDAWSPAIDFFEDGKQLVLQAELAGVDKSDIDIRVEDATLEIRGSLQTRRSHVHEPRDFHRERRHGRFSRTITLPERVDEERIEAELNHGLLTVTLPKLKNGAHRIDAND